MRFYIKLVIISVFATLILCSEKLSAQKIYFQEKDTVMVSTDRFDLACSIYNEDLLQNVWLQDSVVIWVLGTDTCDALSYCGIPWCKDCSIGANYVLQNAYKMSYIDSTIIVGSCWDYLNAVYSRIEAINFKKNELYMTKKAGPYAPKSLLQPGDWVYHVNYQYYQVEHSAIFVCWKDYEKGIAITLSYMGMNRWRTAQFGEYDLNSVYAIFRLEDPFW